MIRKKSTNRICPVCDKKVTFKNMNNVEYTDTKRNTRQYFHRDCYMKTTRKHMRK